MRIISNMLGRWASRRGRSQAPIPRHSGAALRYGRKTKYYYICKRDVKKVDPKPYKKGETFLTSRVYVCLGDYLMRFELKKDFSIVVDFPTEFSMETSDSVSEFIDLCKKCCVYPQAHMLITKNEPRDVLKSIGELYFERRIIELGKRDPGFA